MISLQVVSQHKISEKKLHYFLGNKSLLQNEIKVNYYNIIKNKNKGLDFYFDQEIRI